MAGPTDEELSKQRETTKKLKRCLQNKLTRKKCEKPTSYKTVHLDEHVENGKVVRRWTYTAACPVGEKQSGREKEQKSETETEISICSRRQHKDRNGQSREAGSPEARNRKQKRVQEMELLEIENECRRRQSGSSDQNDKVEKSDVSVSRGSTGPAKLPLAPDHPLPSAHSLIPYNNATETVPPIAGDAGPPPVDTPLPPILSAARRNNTVCLQLKTAMAQRPAMRIFDAKTCCVGGRAVSQQTTCIPEEYYTAKAHLTQTTVKETSPQTRPSTRYAAFARVGSRKIHSKESLISKKSVDVVPLPADTAKSAERITTDYKKGQKDSKESSPEKTKSPRQLETDKVPPTKPRPSGGQLTAAQMDVVFRMMAELNASGVLAQRVDEVNSVVGVSSKYSVSSCGEKQTPEWMALSEKARREPAICKQVTAATDALNAAAHSLKTYMRIGGSATECEPHLATIQKMKKALDKM